VRVDVPLRVFYPGYYPTLTRLYDELGVPANRSAMPATFTDERRQACTSATATCAGRPFELELVAPQDLLAGRARAGHHWPACCASTASAMPALQRRGLGGQSHRRLRGRRATRAAFVDGLLLPAICTVCTCSHGAGARFPAAVMVDYLARGLTRQSVRRALHGADDVAAPVAAGHLRPALQRAIAGAAAPAATQVRVQMDDGSEERFDHVVLATQANQALPTAGRTPAADEAPCWRLPLPAGAGADAHR
jgi:predicted NAD/FAD-binding protein